MRGIAALAVVMQHFSSTAQDLCATTIPSLVPHGYVAVDFFFVLSGYIMCYTYLSSFESQGWRAAYGPFLRKRAIRLLPLNAFVTLSLLVLGFMSVQLLGKNLFFGELRYPFDIVTNLLMLQGLGIGHSMNGPSGTVGVEFVAYMAFPLLAACAFARQRWAMALALAASLLILTSLALPHPRLSLGAEDPVRDVLHCVSEFTLGMFSYRMARSDWGTRWLASDRTTTVVLAICLGLALLRIDLLVALSFPFVVACIGLNSGRVLRALSAPLPYMLGTVSYSLYLIHNAFRPAAFELLKWLHPAPLSPVQALTFALLGSLSVIPFAWLTYHYVEHPSRRLLLRRMAVAA